MCNTEDRNTEYDNFLNEIYGVVTQGYLEWDHADILYNMDPVAYRCGLVDFEDACSVENDVDFVEDDSNQEDE